MTTIIVNFWAVLVAAVAGMIIGGLWYSPLLFGKAWLRLSRLSQEDIDKAKRQGMGRQYVTAFVGTLIMAYVLAHFLAYAGAVTFSQGMEGGAWAWLGFIMPVVLGSVLWEGKPIKLFLINILHYLVALALMGGILAIWG